jgi:chemotaxis methyl-accepting protein methylase
MANIVTENDTTTLDSLLQKVYRNAGHDFREYKRGTVTRRLERRLYATGAKTYSEYVEFLDAHPEEYQRLADDLTIKVSGFFRSSYTFQQVARLVLPELTSLRENQKARSLSFWSTACACGEEPYSIAILLTEFLGEQRKDYKLSIYATDISFQCLEKAQAGKYSPKDIEGLTPKMLKNYLTRRDQDYVVNNNIRRMVRFSYFDLTSTTQQPFIDADCIFCCNVLIYLQRQLQERVLNMLYDSLAAPGYLVLGEAETLTEGLNEKLECLDSRAKIYKK